MKKWTALFLIILLLIGISGGMTDASALSEASSSGPSGNPFGLDDQQRLQRLRDLTQPDDQLTLQEQNQDTLEDRMAGLAQKEAARQEKEAGRTFLIQFKTEVSLSAIEEVLQGETWNLIGPSQARMILLSTGDIAAFSARAAGLTTSIEENHLLQADLAVNDTYYDQQWGLNAIKAPEAWAYTTGNPVGAADPVYVAVIDSGIDRTHPDLDQADIRKGWDYLLVDNCYWDSNGHGTAVSGIIGAETNNAEGIAGVCWNIAIIPLLITYPDGTIYASDLIEAIYDAADVGCKVINLSLGGTTWSNTVNAAVQYAYSAGCLVIASSGNSGTNVYNYPASYDHVISVGSVGSTLAVSNFSTYNDRVDVCAPGEGIIATYDDYYEPYDRYVSVGGTSFSAPHVTGVVALAACLKPDLTYEQLMLLLAATSQDLGQTGYDPNYGYGLIDAGQMLAGLAPSPTVSYQSHVQNIGWQDWMSNGEKSGTSGLAYRLEAMRIRLENIAGGIEYRTHVQNIGWMDWVADSALSGTEGLCLRLEAIDIQLTGAAAEQYDIYYRVHAQNIGWMDWAMNGQSAGTAGFAYRLEAIQIVLITNGGAAPGPTAVPFIDKNALPPIVRYQSHVQNIGWQDWMSNGETSGTSGQCLRLESMRINLENLTGGIEYRTHVQNIGWMGWVADGALSGTEGQCLRLEAIDIRLTGTASEKYDLYYRVHAQNIGWMDWAMNGQSAGTAGFAYRLEAIQIVLVAKGGAAPGPTAVPFVSR